MKKLILANSVQEAIDKFVLEINEDVSKQEIKVVEICKFDSIIL